MHSKSPGLLYGSVQMGHIRNYYIFFISEVEHVRTQDIFIASDKLCARYLIHPYNVAKKGFFSMCVTIHKLPSHFHALSHLTLVSDCMGAVVQVFCAFNCFRTRTPVCVCVCVCLNMAGVKDGAVKASKGPHTHDMSLTCI